MAFISDSKQEVPTKEESPAVSEAIQREIRCMKSYKATLGEMELNYKEYKEDADERYVGYLGSQTNNIRKLAKDLEESGKYRLEKICSMVSNDVEQYDIDSRRVREVLEDKYKQKKYSNDISSSINRYPQNEAIAASEVVTNPAQKDEIPETGQEQELQQQEIKKPILLSNYGSVIEEPEPDNSSKETIDFNQLNKRAAQEIKEDKNEALDYSSSSPSSLKQLNKLKQQTQLIQKLEEENQRLKDDWQFEVDRNRKGLSDKIKVADTIILKENEDLKKQVRGLQTKLGEIDKSVVVKEDDKLLQGYKEIEIFKLDDQRVSWLLQTSRNSERTLFLLANPKTLEILQIKTDKEMHRIQALRKYATEENE